MYHRGVSGGRSVCRAEHRAVGQVLCEEDRASGQGSTTKSTSQKGLSRHRHHLLFLRMLIRSREHTLGKDLRATLQPAPQKVKGTVHSEEGW